MTSKQPNESKSDARIVARPKEFRLPREGPRYVGVARLILPCAATAFLFVGIIFAILLPAMKQSVLDRKREMIRSLTESAWSTLAHYEALERSGVFTRAEAQTRAASQIRKLRYGPEMKDYFWINDMQMRVLVHPYCPEIENRNLADCNDIRGAQIYMSAIEKVLADEQGYIEYVWQWKDDPSRIVPKTSYVKGFVPWGWIVGTGMYTEDVREEIAGLTGELAAWSAAVSAVVLALLSIVIRQNLSSDRRRREAEVHLLEANTWLHEIIDASPFALIVLDHDHACRMWSPAASTLLGWSKEDVIGRRLPFQDLLGADSSWNDLTRQLEQGDCSGRELALAAANGDLIDVSTSIATVRGADGQADGRLVILEGITDRKAAERTLRESESQLQAIFNAVQAGILLLDRDSQEILTVNQTALQMIGQDEHGVIGVHRHAYIRPVVKPDDRQQADSAPAELVLVDTFGRRIPILSNSVPLEVGGRQVVLESIVDIGAMKHAESELMKRVEEVSEAKRRMEVVVSNMAGRERRMVELKQEVNDLLETLGKEPKYQAPREAGALGAISARLRSE